MAEWYDEDDDGQREAEQRQQEESEKEKLQRTLKKEREARKAAEREARLESLRRQHPGLTDEDAELIAGSDPATWEKLAPRLEAQGQQGPSPEEIAAQQQQQAEQLQQAQEEEALRNAGNVQGTPPVPESAAPKKIGRDEAFDLYKKNPQKFREMRAAGLIDLGVTATSRAGGSTTFGG